MLSFSSLQCPSTTVKPSPVRLSPPPSALSLSSHSYISTTLPSLSHPPLRLSSRKSHGGTLIVRNIDAAQPYDYESKLASINNSYTKLKIAIVGFGNYGQFLAKSLVAQGHAVLAHSRSDYSRTASKIGVSFFSDPHDLCEAHPEVILLCTSIPSTEPVLKSLPLQRLKRSTLFVDVLSAMELGLSFYVTLMLLI